MKYHKIKALAGKLRKHQTPSEKRLWNELRHRKLDGRKFLRQHAVIYEARFGEYFFYIADFYCAAEKLIIEVDGPIHDRQKERDEKRDSILMHHGFRVARFRNEELENLSQVISRIRKMFQGEGGDLS